MAGAEEPQFVAETLAWCNERRAEKGKEPLDRLPLGRRVNASSCPCGKAAGIKVFCSFWEDVGKMGITPYPVQKFTMAFDEGELPQYDIELQENM